MIAVVDDHRHRDIRAKELAQAAQIDDKVLPQLNRVFVQQRFEPGRLAWIEQKQRTAPAGQVLPQHFGLGRSKALLWPQNHH